MKKKTDGSSPSFKKRFIITNTLILSIPISVSMLLIIIFIIFFTGGNLIRDFRINNRIDTADVAELGETATRRYDGKLSEDSEQEALDMLERYVRKYSAYVIITQDGKTIHKIGNPIEDDAFDRLYLSACSVNNEAVLTAENIAVFVGLPGEAGNDVRLYFFAAVGRATKLSDMQYYAGFLFFNIVLAVIAAGLILVISKAMMKHIFNTMQRSLDILLDAVREIQAGNLDYRIEYNRKDEFAEVCNEFNNMAEQMKISGDIIRKQQQSRKDMFISISHDIRSPLTSIIAYVEGLIDGIALTPEKQRRYLDIIYHKAQDIDGMVTQILTYSKSELNELPVYREHIQLDRFAAGLLDGIHDAYEAKGLSVAIADSVPVYVFADTDTLKRIFNNIIENSAKYKIKPKGHLLISLAHSEGQCIITFTDDGPGVPQANMPHIFDVLYRGDAARQGTGYGCGMGLAIVKKLVENMSGTVTAQNAPEGGLMITITLPAENSKEG